jgi:t-SNARE complex subunit (syntaxin)
MELEASDAVEKAARRVAQMLQVGLRFLLLVIVVVVAVVADVVVVVLLLLV